MKTTHGEPAPAADGKETCTPMTRETLSRREFMAVSAAAGATILLPGALPAATKEKTAGE